MPNQLAESLKLDESWAYKVTVLADLVARRVVTVVHAVSGLNLSQWRVLAAVADQPGRTASQVVDVTPMDKGIVSRAVTSLVERDFVERRASKQDGRLSHLYLTLAGERAYSAIVAALDESGASGRRSLPETDQQALVGVLNTLIEAYRS